MMLLLAILLFVVISFLFAVAFGRAASLNDLPDGLAYAPPVLPETETEADTEPEPLADGDVPPPLTFDRAKRRQFRSRKNRRRTTGGWGGAVAK